MKTPKKTMMRKIAGVPKLSNIKGDRKRTNFLAIRYTSNKTKSMNDVKQYLDSAIKADSTLKSFVDTVKKEGKELYLVGGSVRDVLAGKAPKDLDFVTNALPDHVAKMINSIGAKNVDVGKAFGVNVLVGKKDTYDIATFRKEEYGDADPHRPTNVEYLKTVQEDLSRRDFTINAMAYDIVNNKLIDPYGGKNDLEHGVIKSVGKPEDRFQEDPLRILRAFRFASTNGFKINKSIMDVIPKFVSNPKTNKLSRERVVAELDKILVSKNPEIGLKGIMDTGMNEIKMSTGKNGQESIDFLPELSHLKDLKQNPEYHKHDALNHTLEVVKNSPANLDVRYAALFHDAGKGLSHIRTFKETTGQPQDIGHQDESSKMTKSILERFGFNANRIKDVQFMVQNHMKLLAGDNKKYMNRYLNDLRDNFNNKESFKTGISNLMDLRIADVSAGLKMDGGVDKLKTAKTALLNHIDTTAFFPSDLKMSGNDVSEILGIKGKEIGTVLKEYIQRVQDGSVKNDKESLISALEKKRDRKLAKVTEKSFTLKLKSDRVKEKDIPETMDCNDLDEYNFKKYAKAILTETTYTEFDTLLLNKYKNGNFDTIDNALKNLNFKVLEQLQKSDDVNPATVISGMDNIINKSTTVCDTILYKVLNNGIFENINESLIGMEFKDCGYFTASLSDKIFKEYIEDNADIVLGKIKIPKNACAVYMENIMNYTDNQMILPRGCVFEITDVVNDVLYDKYVKIVYITLKNVVTY